MTTYLLIIMTGVAATAVAVQLALLRISFDRWRLFDIVFIGAFANGWAWGVCMATLGWLRMARAFEASFIPPYPWYFFLFPLACFSTIFGLASVLPASIVALVYRRQRSLRHGTAA